MAGLRELKEETGYHADISDIQTDELPTPYEPGISGSCSIVINVVVS